MSNQIDIAAIGLPVPCSWRVEQVEGTVNGNRELLTKLTIIAPTGLYVTFYNGKDAMEMGAALKRSGNACQAGLWASALANEPKGGNPPGDPISGSMQGSGG